MPPVVITAANEYILKLSGLKNDHIASFKKPPLTVSLTVIIFVEQIALGYYLPSAIKCKHIGIFFSFMIKINALQD